MLKVGSDFSGVGAFNQALMRLGVEFKEIFACDMDKYARQTFIHNYGEPEYYPKNVYDREIPTEPLDIYMTSPPCQAFSLAGKRLGKEDKRGILFFNSYEFIQTNKPRYFIFENVKGLLSDDGGKTFSEWINMLGGKSVNGNAVIFPYEESVPYHVYWQVLNAKNYGVPQNRERVFIIGIRDDEDNNFRFPSEEHLTKRLRDVLEDEVDEKYFLSQKMINGFLEHNRRHIEEKNQDGFNWKPKDESQIANCLRANAALCATDNSLKVGTWRTHEDGKGFREIEDGSCPTIPARAREDGSGQPVIQIKSATSRGYEEATEGDSINFSVPNSETRRGRVGKGVAQTLDTGCNQAVICGAIRGRGKENNQTLELNSENHTNSLTSVQTDNLIVHNCITEAIGRQGSSSEYKDSCKKVYQESQQIRRLTPRECFRLMDFPDTFTWPVSDSQAYKQAGNSIVVNVLYKILQKLNLK